jgi:DNA-binding response OmpR family regulator
MNEWQTRIVILAEAEATRSLVGDLLRREGFHVELAATKVEALIVCFRLRPQVVLLETVRPEESGSRLARIIRSAAELRPIGSRPAILLLTGRRPTPAQEHTLKRFYGADAVLCTPFEKEALVRAVRQLLSEQRAQDFEAKILREEQEISGGR